MIVEFIDDNRDEFGVEPICDALQVAPSTYRSAKRRGPSARAIRDAVMMPMLVGAVAGELLGVWGPQALAWPPAVPATTLAGTRWPG